MISLDDIRREIDLEQEKLKIPYKYSDGYKRCKNYAENNTLSRVEQLLEIDIWEYLKCIFYVRTDEKKSFKECEEFVNLLKKLTDNLDFYNFKKVFELLIEIADSGEELVVGIRAGESISKEDVLKVVSYLRENRRASAKVMAFLKTYKQMEFDMDNIEYVIKNKYPFMSESSKRKFTRNFLSENFSESSLITKHNEIAIYVREKDKEAKEYDKYNHRAISNYERGFQLLQKESLNDEIRRTNQIIRDMSCDSIKRMVLGYVVEHNRNYYNQLELELNDLSSNYINLYQGILSKFNIEVHPKYIKEVLYVPLEDLEFALSFFKQFNLEEKEILYLLKYSNKSIVDRVKKYSDMGYLSFNFLKNNLNFFVCDNNYLDIYEESLDLLDNYNINPQLFRYNPMILVTDFDTFKNNIILLNEYECIRSLKNSKNYTYLLDKDLSFKLDKMIEFGYYDNLLDNMDVLNKDKNRFLRFDLLNKINMPVGDFDGFMDIIESDRCIVEDELIEDYLLDMSKYHEDNGFFTMDNIESNRVNSLVVSINGELISYPKIKRKISEGYSIKDAVCYGKYFNEEEYSIFTNENSNNY